VDAVQAAEDSCISLTLHSDVIKLRPTNSENTLLYGESIPDKYIEDLKVPIEGLTLAPKKTLLACSTEYVKMPRGYMGFVQTKGTLARFFVFVQCSDAQIDSGYCGRVTFEIYNASEFNIILRSGQPVGNMYVAKLSDTNSPLYDGKYQNSNKPSLPKAL